MNKLTLMKENAKEFNSIISQADSALKKQKIFGIYQSDLTDENNFTTDDPNEKLTYTIKKNKSSIKFEIILNKDLKFEKIKISERTGFDKKNKITLLIGNGIWRSISQKEFNEDIICLDEIFKKYILNTTKLQKYFKNFGEEEFGKLDVVCEIYKQKNNFEKLFINDMNEILLERDKLFNHVVTNIRNACEKIKKTTTYSNLMNEIQKLITDDNNLVDVVTLNYDQLIYPSIINAKTYYDGFKEKNGKLIFDKEFCKWIRKRRNCYSHLHGSFLFREQEQSIEKIPTSSLEHDSRDPLIILTGNNIKYQKIHQNSDESFILHVYNYHFVQSVCQSNILTIIGYGFLDEYLNNDIKYALAKNSKLIINLICPEKYVADYKKKFISKLPEGIDRERVKINHLNPVCDVLSHQLEKF